MAEIKLKKRIKYAGDVFKALVEKGWFPGDAIELLQTIQDADVMDSIVRCQDCKHLYNRIGFYRCTHHRGLREISDDSYCGYGEKREV